MEQNSFTDKERKKIIFISACLIALILILVVASIVVTINRSKSEVIAPTDNEPVTVNIDDNSKEESQENKTEQQNSSAEAEIIVKEEEKTSFTIQTAEVTDTLANTGPEDFFPLAIISGSLTTLLLSFYFAKKNV